MSVSEPYQDELREGIEYATLVVDARCIKHGYPWRKWKGAAEWFRKLVDMGLDAVIVFDPALIEIVQPTHQGSNIHLSTRLGD